MRKLKRDSLSHLLGSKINEGVFNPLKKILRFANNSGFTNLSGLKILNRVIMAITVIIPVENMNFFSFFI